MHSWGYIMLGFAYLKSTPTTFLMRFRNGTEVEAGTGISIFYFHPNSVIVRISLASQDLPFVFEQQTADFQVVTIQGVLTFRVTDPRQLSGQLDHSVDRRGRYQSDDPDALRDRLVRMLQFESNEFIRPRRITDVLQAGVELGQKLFVALASAPQVKTLGLAIESLVVLSIKATPEMESALQAETREATLQKADQAVHERRKLAIDAEQEIRERELQNERINQEKQLQVREAELAANVSIEKGREVLVRLQADNERILAASRTETLQKTLAAMGSVDWKTIAASSEKADARQLIALAFGQLAENAKHIGRLDISPDLLKHLMSREE